MLKKENRRNPKQSNVKFMHSKYAMPRTDLSSCRVHSIEALRSKLDSNELLAIYETVYDLSHSR